MDDIRNLDRRGLFVGICFLCIFISVILLYTVLLTICTCFLCRRLRRYPRNSGREHLILCRRVNTSCPTRRVCTVELMCCCFGCKIAPPMEDNTISEGAGPVTSANGFRGSAGAGYERVVDHTVPKPEDYYILPENHRSARLVRTEDSSNIYDDVPAERRNFHRHPTPAHQTSGLSETYATVLQSGAPSPQASMKSGQSRNVSSGLAQQTPRLVAAGTKKRDEGSMESSMIETEYQPLLSGGMQGVADYTELHMQQHNTAQADALPLPEPAGEWRMKDFAEAESAVDYEVPHIPQKYLTEGSARRKHHTQEKH